MGPSDELFDVVIVGAGFCGLAAGAALQTAGIRFAILEQGSGVGDFWARTYDRIHLHSPWHDLPNDGGANARYPMFKARDDLLRYFREYAERYSLGGRLLAGRRVESIRRSEDSRAEWRLTTTQGTYEARYVIVATAANRAPSIPGIPGSESYEGRLLHSSEYRNAAPFRGQRVLVVGSGNSAAEISLDLVEGGARSVQMWVRGSRHFVPLSRMRIFFRVFRALGQASTEKFDQYHRIPFGTPEFNKLVDMRDKIVGRFGVDLSRYGIRKPVRGIMRETVEANRIPVFDQGAIPRIRRRDIGIIDGNVRRIESFTPKGVRFSDGEEAFDAVVLATGFAPKLGEFLSHPEMLGDRPGSGRRAFPITDGRCRSSVYPSAFFPGFDLTLNGGQSLGRWGWEVGERIAREL